MARRTERKRKVTVVEERLAGLPTAEIAKDRIGLATENALASVAQTVVPAIGEARQRLAPVAEQAIAQSKQRGRRAAVKLGVAEEPKETHKLRNLVLMLGLGALVAALYKKMTGKDADAAWTAGRDTAAAAPAAPVAAAANGDLSDVDPVVQEPVGSDSLATEPTAGAFGSVAGSETEPAVTSAGPIDGSETAPTAPFASEETVESPVPTTPDEPVERRDFN